MAICRKDFERFVRSLYQPGKQIPSDVRKLASIALTNFDELAETTRHRSQRSVYLVSLLRQNFEALADADPIIVPDADADADAGTWLWARLKHLTLGPFRGFREPEPFDLSKRIILFYGPNGSGKSSLCEGLEYALLGDVEEAGSKRIVANTYLTNIHDNRFDPPVLTATNHDGREVSVTANLDYYRFCFIERNRIDAFSRIAARPSGQRSELIATLFGMEQFSNFVSHFNESIDGQLTLKDTQQATLIERKTALHFDQAMTGSEVETLQVYTENEAALAREYEVNTTYEDLKQLIGSQTPGRLQELNQILETDHVLVIGLTRQRLLDSLMRASQCNDSLKITNTALYAKSDQVSFKALYNSVLALQGIVGDRCPACDTLLNELTVEAVNPYEKAIEGLDQLRGLAALQEQQQTDQRNLTQVSRELRNDLKVIAGFISVKNGEVTPIRQYLEQLPDEPSNLWWLSLIAEETDAGVDSSLLEQLLLVTDQIAAQDDLSRQAARERQLNIAERHRLIAFQLRVQAQDLKRQQFLENIGAAKRRIEVFDETNAELIALADQEKIDIERDLPFKEAYDRFLIELRAYREQLPAQLMAGLNDATMDLYNSFNRNDREEDKLSSLHLPLDGNGKIEICFRGNPDARVDALHVLSEGHIRCMGLSVLMAKAKSIECPVIVFDDAINAIDHDHRGGIRETIFESDMFLQTQLIVTCHSNEFIKDIQQHLPAKQRNECTTYLLRHHNGNYQPRVTGNVPASNYIAKARAARDLLDDRTALASSRQALEMISDKVWRWLGSHGHGTLNLMIAGVGAEPSLRNLCDAITKKIREANTFEHPNKQVVQDAYMSIIGIPIDNLIWTYFNKGTHEEVDRDDFDGDVVELIVQKLEEIDRLDLRSRR